MTHNKNILAEIRREQVKVFIVRGWSSSEIAHELGVSSVTIRRDFQVLREGLIEEFKENSMEIVASAIMQLDVLNREVWQLYCTSKEPSVKLKCLKTALDLASKRIDLLISTGNLRPVQPDTLENRVLEGLKKARELKKTVKHSSDY